MPFFGSGLSTRFLYLQLKNIKDRVGDLFRWESACLVCTVSWVQSPLRPARIPPHLQQNTCIYVPSQVNVFPPSLLSVVISLHVTHSLCCPKQDWDAGYHAFSKFLTCFLFPLLPQIPQHLETSVCGGGCCKFRVCCSMSRMPIVKVLFK